VRPSTETFILGLGFRGPARVSALGGPVPVGHTADALAMSRIANCDGSQLLRCQRPSPFERDLRFAPARQRCEYVTGNGRYVGQRLHTRVDSGVNTLRETDGTCEQKACPPHGVAWRQPLVLQELLVSAFYLGLAPLAERQALRSTHRRVWKGAQLMFRFLELTAERWQHAEQILECAR
jgi:hypothetical protein